MFYMILFITSQNIINISKFTFYAICDSKCPLVVGVHGVFCDKLPVSSLVFLAYVYIG